jgi:integrase
LSRYRARYRAPDGRERSKCFARKIDAERFLSTIESSKLRGDWLDPALGKTTVDEWARVWLESVRGTLKPKTVAGYESLLRSRIIPRFGEHPLSLLLPSEVQAWISTMDADGLSASRIREAWVVLSQILDAAVRDGRTARNPTRGVKLPTLQRREAEYFQPREIKRIAQAMPEPYDLLVRLLGTLGLRFGEAAALRRRDIDQLRRRLRIEGSLAEIGGRIIAGPTKSHQTRSVPVPPSLLNALEDHLEKRVAVDADDLVFAGPKGPAPLQRLLSPLVAADAPTVGSAARWSTRNSAQRSRGNDLSGSYAEGRAIGHGPRVRCVHADGLWPSLRRRPRRTGRASRWTEGRISERLAACSRHRRPIR